MITYLRNRFALLLVLFSLAVVAFLLTFPFYSDQLLSIAEFDCGSGKVKTYQQYFGFKWNEKIEDTWITKHATVKHDTHYELISASSMPIRSYRCTGTVAILYAKLLATYELANQSGMSQPELQELANQALAYTTKQQYDECEEFAINAQIKMAELKK